MKVFLPQRAIRLIFLQHGKPAKSCPRIAWTRHMQRQTVLYRQSMVAQGAEIAVVTIGLTRQM
jgi:hypothetical protein